jgi:hypothetical protein
MNFSAVNVHVCSGLVFSDTLIEFIGFDCGFGGFLSLFEGSTDQNQSAPTEAGGRQSKGGHSPLSPAIAEPMEIKIAGQYWWVGLFLIPVAFSIVLLNYGLATFVTRDKPKDRDRKNP